MSYSNKSDALSKLISPTTNNDSIVFYLNNKNLDNTTIFYSDSAKTTIIPAGNKVLPTNYKSLYVTIGGDGKLSTPIEYLGAYATDTSFVEDRVYSGNTKVSNQGSYGGTNLTLSSNLLTDTVWYTRLFPVNDKRWAINNGPISSAPLVNIDLTDMQGFDLLVYSGEWDGFKFVTDNMYYGFVHLAPSPGRQSVIGNKVYYFKPDFWIPNSDFDAVSYFRRMPSINPVKDRYGYDKLFNDCGVPYLDLVNPDASHTDRTSTIMSKGFTERRQIQYQKTYGGSMLRGPRTPSIKMSLNGDLPFRTAIARAYDVPFDDVSFGNDMWNNRICAHLESLIVDNTTWTNGFSSYLDLSDNPPYTYIKYSDCNKYHWTTSWGSGTAYGNLSVVEQLGQGFYAWTDATYAEWNGKTIEFDFEYLPSAQFSENCGIAFSNCIDTCISTVYYGTGQNALGAVIPKYSIYGGGIYNRAAEGSGTSGWAYITSGNYLSSDLYSDYYNYFISGIYSYSSMTGYRAWYKGAIRHMGYFFVTNYENKINEPWYFYNLIHSYDISKKIISEIGVENSEDYSSKRVGGYFWRYMEPVATGTDVAFTRQYIDYQGYMRGDRPEVSPSMEQSLAVWCMGYADGLTMWDHDKGLIGEERQRLIDDSVTYNTNMFTLDSTLTAYCGDAKMNGKGVHDWLYVGYLQISMNKDIVEANTSWLTPEYYKSGSWTSGNANYPVSLYANQVPLCRYKLNAAGTEALVLIISPFNNGYTKETHTVRLPAKSNYQFTVDTWGTYTTVLRLTNL